MSSGRCGWTSEVVEKCWDRQGGIPEWKSAQIDPALDPSIVAFAPPAGAHEVGWSLPPELPWPLVGHIPMRPE
jgi:hypothetical protein